MYISKPRCGCSLNAAFYKACGVQKYFYIKGEFIIMITVSKDNTGDFNSVQAAVDSILHVVAKLFLLKMASIKNVLK